MGKKSDQDQQQSQSLADASLPAPEPQLTMLSAAGKMSVLKALDFAARREGFAGEQLDSMNVEMRAALGA